MTIDTERLARDRAYWDKCAPDETATHYRPEAATWYRARENCAVQYHLAGAKWLESKIWLQIKRKCIPRPAAQPEWGGEGLPPVGVECEVTAHAYHGRWHRLKVTAITNDHVIGYIRDDRESALLYKEHGIEFRPLPTPEDRSVEEIEKNIWPERATDDNAKAIYRAIRDGKIPGVTITEDQAWRLAETINH